MRNLQGVKQAVKMAGWLCIAFIAVATLSPIRFRPPDFFPVDFDRAAAFAVVSALLVIGYPKRWRVIAVMVLAFIIGLEFLQYLSPTRHPDVANIVVKALGEAIGILLGFSILRLWKLRMVARKGA